MVEAGSSAASPAGSGGDGSGVEAGFLAAAVGFAVEDEFVGGGLESVDGGLGQEGFCHLGQPLDGLPVRGHHGGSDAVSFHDELVAMPNPHSYDYAESTIMSTWPVGPTVRAAHKGWNGQALSA